MGIKLCNDNLQAIADAGLAQVPTYDRNALKSGVVHLGPSHFGRAHTMIYLDDIAKQDPNWGVTMIALRSEGVRDALRDQDYLYTVKEQDGKSNPTRVIGCIKDMIVAPEDPNAALEKLASHNTKLVTMTVTEKGYGHNPETGLLDFDREDIQKCLDPLDEPSTAIGYLVAALQKRMETGAPPLTIMSCDNIEANGTVLKNVVLAYATKKSPELRKYIEDNATFPSTMVDRIVPTTTPEQKAFGVATSDIQEAWPVITEGFKQWVIEDKFAGDVPDFGSVGAQVTDDVNPFKLMKMRLLNGGHMAVGTVGKIAGFERVHTAMSDPTISKLVRGFMEEVSHTLRPISNVDYSLYMNSLIERLENPALNDENSRVVRNATLSKIKPRALEAAEDAIANYYNYNHIAFVTAAWIHYLKGIDDNGEEFDINDAYAQGITPEQIAQNKNHETNVDSLRIVFNDMVNGQSNVRNALKRVGSIVSNALTAKNTSALQEPDISLQEIARTSNGNPAPVIGASNVFSTSLQGHKGFNDAIKMHLNNIQEHGVIGAIDRMDEAPAEPAMVRKFGNELKQ